MTVHDAERAGRRRTPGSRRRFLAALGVFAIVAIGIPLGLIAVTRLTLSSSHPVPGVGL